MPCSAPRRRPPRTRRRSARTARQRRSTHWLSDLVSGCPQRSARIFSRFARRVLPDRPVRRGHRRDRGGASDSVSARRQAQGGQCAPAAVAVPLVSGAHGGCAERFGARRRDAARGATAHRDYGLLEESPVSVRRRAGPRRAESGRPLGHPRSPPIPVEQRRHAVAERYLEEGIAFCSERGFELFVSTCLRLARGWTRARGAGRKPPIPPRAVLRVPRTSTTPRIHALMVLALVRARRGDPEVVAAPGRGMGAR